MHSLASLRRRTYTTVDLAFCTHTGRHILSLDGAEVHTHAGHALASTDLALMQALAQEWDAQQGEIAYASMPHTRVLAAMLDVDDAAIRTYHDAMTTQAYHDMVTLHDPHHAPVYRKQQEIYGPILQWAQQRFGVTWSVHDTLCLGDPPADVQNVVQHWLAQQSPASMVLAYILCSLSDSWLLSVAWLEKAVTTDIFLDASWLERDVHMQRWGDDPDLRRLRAQDGALMQVCEYHRRLIARDDLS